MGNQNAERPDFVHTHLKAAKPKSPGAESGRSILEVLAVLAVASVLSIGGVEGYRVAMRKHQANELIEGANQRAIAVAQQLALDKKIVLFPLNR